MQRPPTLPPVEASPLSIDPTQHCAPHPPASVCPGVSPTVCNQSGSVETQYTPVSNQNTRYAHNPYTRDILHTETSKDFSTDQRNNVPSVDGIQISPVQRDHHMNSVVSVCSFSPHESPGLTARRPGQVDERENSAVMIPSTLTTPQHIPTQVRYRKCSMPFLSLDPCVTLSAESEQGFGSCRHDEHLMIPHDEGPHFNNPNPTAWSASWRNKETNVSEETPPKRLQKTKMLPSPPQRDKTLCVFKENKVEYPEVTLFCKFLRWYERIEKHQLNYHLYPKGCRRPKQAMELNEWCPVPPLGTPNAEESREWEHHCEEWWNAEFGDVEVRRAPGRLRGTYGNNYNRSGH